MVSPILSRQDALAAIKEWERLPDRHSVIHFGHSRGALKRSADGELVVTFPRPFCRHGVTTGHVDPLQNSEGAAKCAICAVDHRPCEQVPEELSGAARVLTAGIAHLRVLQFKGTHMGDIDDPYWNWRYVSAYASLQAVYKAAAMAFRRCCNGDDSDEASTEETVLREAQSQRRLMQLQTDILAGAHGYRPAMRRDEYERRYLLALPRYERSPQHLSDLVVHCTELLRLTAENMGDKRYSWSPNYYPLLKETGYVDWKRRFKDSALRGQARIDQWFSVPRDRRRKMADAANNLAVTVTPARLTPVHPSASDSVLSPGSRPSPAIDLPLTHDSELSRKLLDRQSQWKAWRDARRPGILSIRETHPLPTMPLKHAQYRDLVVNRLKMWHAADKQQQADKTPDHYSARKLKIIEFKDLVPKPSFYPSDNLTISVELDDVYQIAWNEFRLWVDRLHPTPSVVKHMGRTPEAVTADEEPGYIDTLERLWGEDVPEASPKNADFVWETEYELLFAKSMSS